MFTPEDKEELKEGFRKIRENNLLVWGILIGIIGSLIAGIINDLIRESTFYPWPYLIILTIILLILIWKLLRGYIEWKVTLYKMNKWMKHAKKVLSIYNPLTPQNSPNHLYQ